MELNSWQLFRLLQAQLSGLSCGNTPGLADNQRSGTNDCNGSIEERLCCLYMNAAILHNAWLSEKVSE